MAKQRERATRRMGAQLGEIGRIIGMHRAMLTPDAPMRKMQCKAGRDAGRKIRRKPCP
jgi:hypothetical protein